MEIKGTVHEVGAIQQVTESFKKRDLVIAYAENPQFVEYISLQATQDRVNIFDQLNTGDEVEVSYNLRGRPWTNKEGVTTYFNSLVAWRVTKLNGQATASAPAPVDINNAEGEDDDLPF